ncbi:hypothetical protein ACW73L_02800 [Methylolobus aquaticus]|nr:hypothetical protein EWI61_12970 [Methylolobus aquaticus]
MTDGPFSAGRKEWLATLLPWLLLLAGTVASFLLPGVVAEVGMLVALIGFVIVLIRLHRAGDA